MSINGNDGVATGFSPSGPYGVWGDAGSPAADGVVGSSKTYGVSGHYLSTDIYQKDGAGVYGVGNIGVAGYTPGSVVKPPHSYVAVFGCSLSNGNPNVVGSTGMMGLGDEVGVEGRTGNGTGVFGHALTGTAVGGESVDGVGVSGMSFTRIGVEGVAGYTGSPVPDAVGVRGQSRDGAGVLGASTGLGAGVVGRSSAGVGVYGAGFIGVSAMNATGVNAAILGSPVSAGTFWGDVRVLGSLSKAGGGFVIDHPLDPTNRTLTHSFVESPERKNLYDGIAVLDAAGEAEVALPAWFTALNEDFRYQLTCVGQHAAVYVASEIQGNRFRIAGGSPGSKVSWQVTGARKDAWARANPLVADEMKPQEQRGLFLHPAAHGAPIEQSVRRVLFPDPPVVSTLPLEEPAPRSPGDRSIGGGETGA